MTFVETKPEGWGRFGLRLAVTMTALTLLLGIAHGVMERPSLHGAGTDNWAMWLTWVSDLRYLAEQLIYVGALVFVGAKFFETRTIFTVGFDKLDAAKVAMKGPDDDNIVWIGHRYASKLEAETVAAAIGERLKESA